MGWPTCSNVDRDIFLELELRTNVSLRNRKDLDMRKLIAMMAAGSLSALMALTSTAPAQAMPFQPVNPVAQQSDVRNGDIQDVDWRDHRRGWDRRDDRRDWRRDRDYGRDRHYRHHGGNGAAIIGGLAAGAIIGGAIANSNNNRYYYHNGRRYLRD
jgi:hypothetical protein